MKKIGLISCLIAVILALYIGMAIRTTHPMDQLYTEMIKKINETRVVSFKAGFNVYLYDSEQYQKKQRENKEQDYTDGNYTKKEWEFKRQGTYDAWSKFLYYKNGTRFEGLAEEVDEAEEETSLTPNPVGNMIALPIREAYFKNGMYFEQYRTSDKWTFQSRSSAELLELLPLNAEVLNRYASFYRAENRKKFVVNFFSVDPNYLTRTFPDILDSHSQNFPIRFKEGTIKMLVYPDTKLPRKVYSLYVIENIDTGEIYEYIITTYFSEDETYQETDEPSIPWSILSQHR